MKTIEQAAKDYADSQITTEFTEYGNCVRGFYAGVAFAQQWNDVKDLPQYEKDKQYLVKGYYQIKDLKGNETCRVCKASEDYFNAFGYFGFDSPPNFVITHWRHIELE